MIINIQIAYYINGKWEIGKHIIQDSDVLSSILFNGKNI